MAVITRVGCWVLALGGKSDVERCSTHLEQLPFCNSTSNQVVLCNVAQKAAWCSCVANSFLHHHQLPSAVLTAVVLPAARCLHTVQHHSDYVTCLAASEAAGKLVSAGLRSEVITYDMQVWQL